MRAVQTGRAIPMQEFTADLKHRMKGVKETLSWWTATRTTTNWPNEHSRFATPFSRNERMPTDYCTTVSSS